jgi:hypothetical protein
VPIVEDVADAERGGDLATLIHIPDQELLASMDTEVHCADHDLTRALQTVLRPRNRRPQPLDAGSQFLALAGELVIIDQPAHAHLHHLTQHALCVGERSGLVGQDRFFATKLAADPVLQ